MAHQRIVDLVSLLLAERTTQVDAADLRTDVDGQRIDGDGCISRHRTSLPPRGPSGHPASAQRAAQATQLSAQRAAQATQLSAQRAARATQLSAQRPV